MTLNEMLASGGGVLFILSVLVQIAPIKINPWTWIGRHIGNAINHDIKEEMKSGMKEMKSEMQNLNEKVDKNQEHQLAYEKVKEEEKMDACRSRILRFGDECRRGIDHSEEFFNQILEDITKYENYCREHPDYKNSKAVKTIEKIKKIYDKCVDEDSFL